MMRALTVLVFIIAIWKAIFCQTCPSWEIQIAAERRYFLSNDQVDAETSERYCSALNGKLVLFADSLEEREALELIYQKYIEGLQDVFMFVSAGFRNTRYANTSSLSDWSPFDYQKWWFKFYREPTGVYNQIYKFCSSTDFNYGEISGGTQVTAGQCRSSFNLDFTMYGGTAQTPRTIPLYNYHNGFLASRLSLTDEPFLQTENSIHNYNSRLPPVYAPDIYVFTGASSEVSQTQWYWSNQTIATDPKLPSPSSNRCEQAAIKYNYIDANLSRPWVFTSQNCTGSQAYYVCEIKESAFEASVVAMECNGTLLNSSLVFNENILQNKNDWMIQIEWENKSFTAAINDVNSTLLLGGLQKDTEYDVKVLLKRKNCDILQTIQYVKTLRARTATETPTPPVNGARVRCSKPSFNGDCVIEWEYSDYDIYIQSQFAFRIQVFNCSSLLDNFIITPNISADRFSYLVDVKRYPETSNLHFQISATSCLGASNFTLVSGACFVPARQTSVAAVSDIFFSTPVIIVTATLCTIIVILIAIVGKLLRNSKKISKENKSKRAVKGIYVSNIGACVDGNAENKLKTKNQLATSNFQGSSGNAYENLKILTRSKGKQRH